MNRIPVESTQTPTKAFVESNDAPQTSSPVPQVVTPERIVP